MTTRRTLLKSAVGAAAVSALLQKDGFAATGLTHFSPKAKRVVYLFQSGGPSHLELLDEKPELKRLHGTELPDSIRQGQRLTGMTSGQTSFPVVASKFGFRSCGQSGTRVSELLPHTGKVIDIGAGRVALRTIHVQILFFDGHSVQLFDRLLAQAPARRAVHLAVGGAALAAALSRWGASQGGFWQRR